MARILWPPIVRDRVYPFAAISSMVAGRLRLSHVIIWALLATVLFTIAAFNHASELLEPDGNDDGVGGGTLLPPFVVPSHLQPKEPVRIAKANRFDDRYEFQRHLDHGHGHDLGRSRSRRRLRRHDGSSTALYRDMHTGGTQVVVKSYYHPSERYRGGGGAPQQQQQHQRMAPPWVALFCHELSTWPTEIPATLLLAGLEGEEEKEEARSSHNNTTRPPIHRKNQNQHRIPGLVPARDYFIALEPAFSSPIYHGRLTVAAARLLLPLLRPLFPASWTAPRWSLVTTYPPLGTLVDLWV
ncbi:hypothetical protein SLS58_000989 [Diplodia intermedia]|uniref:Mannosyltransferase n=1 Tax=Diplodia intermedia TaxID=856260 RepID=A0ABR3U3R7_9PEZI